MFIILLWCIVGYLAECGIEEEAKALRFPKEVSVDNHVKLTSAIPERLTAVSVCTWMKKFLDPSGTHYWFSYASEEDYNEIVLSDSGINIISGTWMKSRGAVLFQNQWYHFCMTWSASTRKMHHYVNGLVVNSIDVNLSSVRAGGILILGNEQDSYGGKFALSQAFGGDLYQLNVFSRKLSAKDVSAMYYAGRCTKLPSTLASDIVISWKAILDAPRSGDVHVTSIGCNFQTDRSFLDKVTKLVLQEHLTRD